METWRGHNICLLQKLVLVALFPDVASNVLQSCEVCRLPDGDPFAQFDCEAVLCSQNYLVVSLSFLHQLHLPVFDVVVPWHNIGCDIDFFVEVLFEMSRYRISVDDQC